MLCSQAFPEQELQGRAGIMQVGDSASGVWGLPPAEAHHCEFWAGSRQEGLVPWSSDNCICVFESTPP